MATNKNAATFLHVGCLNVTNPNCRMCADRLTHAVNHVAHNATTCGVGAQTTEHAAYWRCDPRSSRECFPAERMAEKTRLDRGTRRATGPNARVNTPGTTSSLLIWQAERRPNN